MLTKMFIHIVNSNNKINLWKKVVEKILKNT